MRTGGLSRQILPFETRTCFKSRPEDEWSLRHSRFLTERLPVQENGDPLPPGFVSPRRDQSCLYEIGGWWGMYVGNTDIQQVHSRLYRSRVLQPNTESIHPRFFSRELHTFALLSVRGVCGAACCFVEVGYHVFSLSFRLSHHLIVEMFRMISQVFPFWICAILDANVSVCFVACRQCSEIEPDLKLILRFW